MVTGGIVDGIIVQIRLRLVNVIQLYLHVYFGIICEAQKPINPGGFFVYTLYKTY